MAPLPLGSRPPTPIEARNEIVNFSVQDSEKRFAEIGNLNVGSGFGELDQGDAVMGFTSTSARSPFHGSPNVPNVGFKFGGWIGVGGPHRGDTLGLESGLSGICPREIIFHDIPNLGSGFEEAMEEAGTRTPKVPIDAHLKPTPSPQIVDDVKAFFNVKKAQALQRTLDGIGEPVMWGLKKTDPKCITQVSKVFGSSNNYPQDKPVNSYVSPKAQGDGSYWQIDDENHEQQDQQQSEYESDLGDDDDDEEEEKEKGKEQRYILRPQKKNDKPKQKKLIFKINEETSSTRAYNLRSRHKANKSQPVKIKNKTPPPPELRLKRLKISLGEEITNFEDYPGGCLVYGEFGRRVKGYQLDPF